DNHSQWQPSTATAIIRNGHHQQAKAVVSNSHGQQWGDPPLLDQPIPHSSHSSAHLSPLGHPPWATLSPMSPPPMGCPMFFSPPIAHCPSTMGHLIFYKPSLHGLPHVPLTIKPLGPAPTQHFQILIPWPTHYIPVLHILYCYIFNYLTLGRPMHYG
ncbi:hypothetical protein PAXRUDRAFT_771118, partial [Paxillus rubicundulus Ve08.2h10]